MASASTGIYRGPQTTSMKTSAGGSNPSQAREQGHLSLQPECNNQKPFQCGLCSVMFAINGELVTHVSNHSRVNPFQCGFCKLSYASNVHLLVHVRKHTVVMLPASLKPSSALVGLSIQSSSSGAYVEAALEDIVNDNNHSPTVKTEATRVKVKEELEDDSARPGPSHSANSSRIKQVGSEMVLENPLSLPISKTKTKSEFSDVESKDQKEELSSELSDDDESKSPDLSDPDGTPNQCSIFEKKYIESKHPAENMQSSETKRQTEMRFSCSKCNSTFKKPSYVKAHMKRVHKVLPTLSCTQCLVSFKTKQALEDHLASHAVKRPFQCNYCSFRFKSKKSVNFHMSTKHDQQLPHPCTHCSKRFSSKKQWLTHNCARHSGKSDAKSEENSYRCSHCPASFKVKGTLSAHILIKHNNKGDAISDRPFSCPHCPWKFKHKFKMDEHIARIHDTQLFPCPHCAKLFRSRADLTCHGDRMHKTDTPHQCAECGKCFKQKRNLKMHFCKPKECPICKHVLNCLTSYQHHMRRNHSDNNFKCSSCERGFLTQRELDVHARTHTKEKPFTCEFCGQSCASLTSLTYHRNSRHLDNRPFKCNLCQKGFNSYPSYYQHKRRHAGDKRYSCDQCGKTFYNSGSLKRHALTHGDLRTFVCSECGKTYKSYGSLKYHLKHVHQL